MAYPPGMELHGSKWRIKKRVPADILKNYPQFFSKPFEYLYTGEADKRKAAQLGWQWISELELKFQRIRDTGSPDINQLSNDLADLIIQKTVCSTISSDERLRNIGLFDPIYQAVGDWIERSNQRVQSVISRGVLGEEDVSYVKEILKTYGVCLSEESEDFRLFGIRLFRQLSEAIKVRQLRQNGIWVETPALPEKNTPQIVPMLSEVIEQFIAKQRDDVPMYKKYRPALSLFLECVGDKPVSQIKQLEIDEYFELLCRLPPRWLDEKRKSGLSVRELVQQDWPKCISKKTFEDGYMAAFRPFLQDSVRVFQDQGFPPHLTITGIKYSGKREESENEQRAMQQDELERLFCGPEYQKFASVTCSPLSVPA